MATAVSIDPTGICDDPLVSDLLGVGAQTLARARRSGELRFIRKGQRILYLGEWLLAWLKSNGEGRP